MGFKGTKIVENFCKTTSKDVCVCVCGLYMQKVCKLMCALMWADGERLNEKCGFIFTQYYCGVQPFAAFCDLWKWDYFA